ncbi:MAG TPA: hypothetical protein VGS28_00340 [Candidatus Saccharimonadales bacterium]|nr:hypothetical protein [Candidatus Saccharimonadales bacterium]
MKVLSFDIESNGLHGPAFSVGAVLVDSDGRKVIDDFVARCPIVGDVDEWVSTNVLPVTTNIKEDCKDDRELRDKFWTWYTNAKAQADIVVAANPYPVEARFLIACQDDDIEKRYWGHPFPLLDLGTMLYTIGLKSSEQRGEYISKVVKDRKALVHNPRWDAEAAALAALHVLNVT